MKKNHCLPFILSAVLLCGCSSTASSSHAETGQQNPATPTPSPFTRKTSEDPHIAYINQYVGMNAASVGYTSLSEDRMDHLGEGYVQLEFVTEDGSYVGSDEEDQLKNYVITAQNVKPNTEVHFTYSTDEDGKEDTDGFPSSQTIDEIDLAVKKVGSRGKGPKLTEITPSPDKYSAYIRNYVGKNLYTVGYTSLGGDFRDRYGEGNILLNIATEDGSYIDIKDKGLMKQYVVTGQSVPPNTQITYTYDKDSDGKEYDNLISSQSIDSINLTVKTITGKPAVPSTTASPDSE